MPTSCHVVGVAGTIFERKIEKNLGKSRGFPFFRRTLIRKDECDQLWLVLSAIRDPWTIYVKFAEVPTKEQYEQQAKALGWQPEALAEKLLLDFLESVTHKEYHRRYLSEGSK
jgi:hypothetical protein